MVLISRGVASLKKGTVCMASPHFGDTTCNRLLRNIIRQIAPRSDDAPHRRSATSKPGLTDVQPCLLFESFPARIRRKPAAEFVGQGIQSRDHVLYAAGSRIVQRTAAERRVAGTEDDGAVDYVGILDDALAQTGDTDIRHRQNQPVDHLCRWFRDRGHAAGVGLAVLPGVKALAGLAAE